MCSGWDSGCSDDDLSVEYERGWRAGWVAAMEKRIAAIIHEDRLIGGDSDA